MESLLKCVSASREMRVRDIRRLVRWLSQSSVSLLEIGAGNCAVRIRMSGGSDGPIAAANLLEKRSNSDDAETKALSYEVQAQDIGMFLKRHPSLSRDACTVGDLVEAGSCLGFICAGLVLRPVRTVLGGVVEGVLVQNGDMVDYGTPLFRVQQVTVPTKEGSKHEI